MIDRFHKRLNMLCVFTILMIGPSGCDLITGDRQDANTQDAQAEGSTKPEELSERILAKNTVDRGEMVLIPAGSFLMGTSEFTSAQLASSFSMNFWDEMPQREVELDAFYIDKYEVTNEQYLRFLSSPAGEQYRPRFWNHPKFNHPKQPVVGVTREAADAYAKWAGKRLPTEAEWEKSAWGTDGRIYPWGDVFFEDRLNYNFKFDRPTLVGQYPTGLSPYRVLDMAGNVSEWVADLYDPKLYAKGGNKNPFNNVEGTEYVHRGGMWNDWRFKHLNVRCARRLHAPPETQSPAMGFRCASTGPPRQPPTTQQ